MKKTGSNKINLILSRLLYIHLMIFFLIHQFLQKILLINFSILDNYLDMLLIMPLLLPVIRLERILLWKFPKNYRLTILEILAATIIVGSVSEFIFPVFTDRFTMDLIDWIPLTAGGLGYYFWIRYHY